MEIRAISLPESGLIAGWHGVKFEVKIDGMAFFSAVFKIF
jgi:hypothetical protein